MRAFGKLRFVAEPPLTDPRFAWAAERTLLAWIRTGVAMMGFGFVVARLDLIGKRQLTPAIGASLAILGLIVNVVATVRFRMQVEALRRGHDLLGDTRFPIVVGIGSAFVGAALAYALLR